MASDATKHMVHWDGRRCMWFPSQRKWLHWDRPVPDPGPLADVDHECDRIHTDSVSGPLPVPSDRGEFGMPGLGVGRVLDFEPVKVDGRTDEARAIVEDVLPRLMEKFLRKNAQYARAQTGHDLGLKGIIPDINRKTAALITAVWDGEGGITGGDTDSARDIAEDLVGHLLLMLAKMSAEAVL